MKCAACTRAVRTTRRALILTGPGKLKSGRVCNACAAAGWLLVLGDDRPLKRRVAAKRQRVAIVEDVIEQMETGRGVRVYKPGMFREPKS